MDHAGEDSQPEFTAGLPVTEAAAKAAGVAKREAEEESIREQRAKEQEKRQANMVVGDIEEIPKTAAKIQKTELEKMLETLNRIHKRIL